MSFFLFYISFYINDLHNFIYDIYLISNLEFNIFVKILTIRGTWLSSKVNDWFNFVDSALSYSARQICHVKYWKIHLPRRSARILYKDKSVNVRLLIHRPARISLQLSSM